MGDPAVAEAGRDALCLGLVAATVVLAFDVRARVDGDMTHCGNGMIGVHVPLFDDPPTSFYDQCASAIRRWRVAAVGTETTAFATVTGLTARPGRQRQIRMADDSTRTAPAHHRADSANGVGRFLLVDDE